LGAAARDQHGGTIMVESEPGPTPSSPFACYAASRAKFRPLVSAPEERDDVVKSPPVPGRTSILSADDLLLLARETVEAVPTCLAITVNGDGGANARAINPSKPSTEWVIRFMTDRRTRKFSEIVRTGRMTLVYFHEAGGAYVSLVGRARIIDDVTVKQAGWHPGNFKWHPGGPTDPNVVIVEFEAERIETWNTPEGIVPDPTRGLWAAVLTRDADSWRYAGNTQQSQFNPC